MINYRGGERKIGGLLLVPYYCNLDFAKNECRVCGGNYCGEFEGWAF